MVTETDTKSYDTDMDPTIVGIICELADACGIDDDDFEAFEAGVHKLIADVKKQRSA